MTNGSGRGIIVWFTGLSGGGKSTIACRVLDYLLARNDVVVLVSAISPYRAVRDEVRRMTSARFLEVCVSAPLEICEQRDPKGLYRKARAGELRHFTGIDDPYEPPLAPEITCFTDRESVDASVEFVIRPLLALLFPEPGACPD